MFASVARVSLDPTSGRIAFGECVVHLDAELDELSDTFTHAHLEALVEGRSQPCVFATASLVDGGTSFGLCLRYEERRLVSAALFIEPPEFRNLSDDDFYGSTEARYKFHSKWLAQQGFSSKVPCRTAWGIVGVGWGKSENVFIYVQTHSRHSGVAVVV